MYLRWQLLQQLSELVREVRTILRKFDILIRGNMT